ncbi:MAG TPA: 30S ribosomal protein S3 [Candidatus Colwellbacteria bacterium]|jgi:small subunit ribosomal protein S3|nr:30S ribosomal protein S3 [Candidatus Colwellbacteria bacterium]
MSQKIKPTSFRLGVLKNWDSRWFADPKNRKFVLEEDSLIRKLINKKLREAGIASVEIERTASSCRIIIKASRPGIIIGRGGKGIEDITKLLNREISKLHKRSKLPPTEISLTVMELGRGDISAQVVAQNIANDLEKRFRFRPTIKKAIEDVMNHREVKGVKIKLSGRLDGAEISRREWLTRGSLPLSSLRADIDYAEATAFATYGAVGIKVWIYKGEVFTNDEKSG